MKWKYVFEITFIFPRGMCRKKWRRGTASLESGEAFKTGKSLARLSGLLSRILFEAHFVNKKKNDRTTRTQKAFSLFLTFRRRDFFFIWQKKREKWKARLSTFLHTLLKSYVTRRQIWCPIVNIRISSNCHFQHCDQKKKNTFLQPNREKHIFTSTVY